MMDLGGYYAENSLTYNRLLSNGLLLLPFRPPLANLFRHLVVKTVAEYDVKDGKKLPQRELLPDVHLLCRCTSLFHWLARARADDAGRRRERTTQRARNRRRYGHRNLYITLINDVTITLTDW